VSVIAKKFCMEQNRCQKVFNKGPLLLCRGAWHWKFNQKLHGCIAFHISVWGDLVLCLGWLSPTEPPVGTGLGCRPDVSPKHYDKLNPEPGPTRLNSAAANQKLYKTEDFRELNVTLAELTSKLMRQTLVLTCSLRAESLLVASILCLQ